MSEHATTSRESMTKGIRSTTPINHLDGSRSPSPFGNLVATPLKSGSTRKNSNAISEAGLFEIKRTRSLDDRHHQIKNNHQSSHEDIEMFGTNYCEGDSSSCIDDKDEGTAALHSSFDVSLLRGGGGASCSSGEVTLFESDGDSQTIGTRNTSFDATDVPSFEKNFNNYQRPRRAMHGEAMSIIDLKPPATVRKKKQSESRTARRRSSDSMATATTAATSMSYALSPFSASKTPARTPGRPLRHTSGYDSNARTPFSSQKSPVPPSTSKRRRAPFAHPARQSPMRRVTNSSLSSPAATSSISNTPTPFQTAPPFGMQPTISFGDLSAQTPTHQNLSSDPSNSFFKKATQLETTFEADGDSVDTNSPARFRFTSFPASLPRVHHTSQYPRLTPPVCPGSVRKRMSFDTEDDPAGTDSATNIRKGEDDTDPVGLNYSNNQHDAVNQSRDDDGTQNTSLSSLSVEGGHHQHLPHLPHQHPPHFASAPTKNLLLFPGERDGEKDGNELNNNLFGYSDDDDEEDNLPSANFCDSGFDRNPSPDQEGGVRRTRLNFNVFLSPTHDKKARSKENEFDGCRRIDLSPNVDLSRPYNSQNRINSFPSTLSSHTQMNASNNTNEESLIVGTSSSSMTPPRTVVRKGNNNPPNTPQEVHLHFPLESECSPILGAPKQDFGDSTTLMDRQQNGNTSSGASSAVPNLLGNRFLPKSSISSPFNSGYQGLKQRSQQKEEASVSSSSESSTSTQKRRLRPMPDMSAFEAVKSSSARVDRSGNGGATVGEGRVMPPLVRRERPCPPTPQRTPAWANEGGSHVFNSLISNKVLLSCPSQVLEGRTSLETSVLDEDSKASGSRRNSFSNASDRSMSAKDGTKSLSSSREEESGDDDDMLMDVEKYGAQSDQSAPVLDTIDKKTSRDEIAAPPKLMRRLPSKADKNGTVSFADDFEILGSLGSGAFADVYKVRLKSDNNLYAVKRNRRQFRGKRDRDVALAEVQSMQRLQSVFASHNTSGDKKNEEHFKSISSEYNRNCYSLYLLFFYRAWQEDGYFYSQTELCCRDTCREMLDSLRFLWNSAKKKYPSLVRKLPPPSGVQAGSQLDSFGRLVPNMSIWKICHDISAGLSHIHSHGIVHQDIKPSNIFFVTNARFGAMCKIGDFGLAGSIGSSGDGQEGDTRYLPPELLASATRHTSADIFSLGLTLYEIATDEQIEMPSDGPRWHQLRSSDEPKLPACRGENLQRLLQAMTDPDERKRPTADTILTNENVKAAGNEVDTFLQDYLNDVEEYDRREEELLAMDRTEDQTPRNGHRHSTVRSPSLSMLLPRPPNLLSPQVKILRS